MGYSTKVISNRQATAEMVEVLRSLTNDDGRISYIDYLGTPYSFIAVGCEDSSLQIFHQTASECFMVDAILLFSFLQPPVSAVVIQAYPFLRTLQQLRTGLGDAPVERCFDPVDYIPRL